MKTVLIVAHSAHNGLYICPDAMNPRILNVRKFSANNRDNGLVCRYNTLTGNIIRDGTSWRRYVRYTRANDEQIKALIQARFGGNVE